jgi:predicted RNA-binding Zn-ribbon protein involved in translation (DUF1610 family)
MATKKIDPRLGKQIDGMNPKCPECGHFMKEGIRGFISTDLLFVYDCKNCGVSYERRKP